MTVRAISHQIVTAIQSTCDGLTARHPHNTVDLLFSCCVMTEHQTCSMHPPTSFRQSKNRYTRQRPKPRFHLSQKCHDFASIIAFAALQLTLWLAVSSCLLGLRSDAVAMFTDAQLLLSLSLVEAHCSHFSPRWKDIPKIFRPNMVQ